jgi:mannose-1-phosphate guanylyltransferase
MKAIVLVGGFGTRLRPLTSDTPKQMLPIVDRPMIEWVVAHLADHGVELVVLSLGFRPEPFLERYADGQCAGVRLHYAVEPEPLDTAGAVRFAAEHAGLLGGSMDEPLLVLNGDVLTDLDITALVAFHRDRGAEGTIHLSPVEDPSRYGVVPVDADGRVIEFIEKPPREQAPSHWINAGTYVLEHAALARVPAGRRVSIERETFPAMVGAGTLFGFPSDDYWIDTGTPQTYVQAQLDLTNGSRKARVEPVAPTADVAGATVLDSIVMADAMVAAGATVERAVVFPHAQVEAGACVRESIIGARSVVGADAVVDEWSVIGQDQRVPDHARLAAARVPEPAEEAP